MTIIKNVAIAGASGNVGAPILKALIDSGKFNITVLSRIGSTATFPAGVKVAKVDFSSVESLTPALSGQDAVVASVASPAVPLQTILVDAAIAAGVKRFLPSEFGSNLANPLSRKLPVFAGKIKVQDYLIEKAKETGLTYTFVFNGAFLDWGLKYDFILKTSDSQPVLIDGGDYAFSTTSLPSVGQAVVGVLSHPEETKNRAVYVSDIITTQNKLFALAKNVAPNRPWEAKDVSLDDLVAGAVERLKKGIMDKETFGPFLARAIFDPKYGGAFEKNDNELLGVKGKTEADVEELFREVLK